MFNSITYLIFEDKFQLVWSKKFYCHMYTLCDVHWLATSSKSKLQIKQQEMAAHGRGCPEGEEAPHGAEIAVCSHPQVIKLNVHTAMHQARVCRNLRYSLSHLKSRDKQTYLAILDSIVMGPSHISTTEAEALLNINSYLFKWVTHGSSSFKLLFFF